MIQTQKTLQKPIFIVITLDAQEQLNSLYPYLDTLNTPYSLHLFIPDSEGVALNEHLKCSSTETQVHPFSSQKDYYRLLFILLQTLHLKQQHICFLNPGHTYSIIDYAQNWSAISIKPLLTSQKEVDKHLLLLNSNKHTLIASAELHTSAQNLHTAEAPFLYALLKGFDIKEPLSDWASLLTDNFWIDHHTLTLLLKHRSLFINAVTLIQEKRFSHFTTFVTLCLKQYKKDLTLIYSCDESRDTFLYHPLRQTDKSTYPSFDLTTVIEQAVHTKENYTLIKGSDHFIEKEYLKQTFISASDKTDPLLHFLRYGVYTNLAPSPSFSPFMYISMYSEMFKKGENPLRSAITHQHTITMPTSIDYNEHKHLIRESGLFDLDYYIKKNPDVNTDKIDHFSHYCFRGWEEDRKPYPLFDVIWYKNTYLSTYLQPINALLHYILLGRLRGHRIRPFFTHPKPIELTQEISRPRRVTLFAAYDQEGIIDDVVLEYVTELSRHSDLYFLADYDLSQKELDKLNNIAKGAWGIRHGEYDFGSYKRLAKYLVGWKKLQEYDEILLVNDSSYLLRPLDDVFKKMSSKRCSWWGMQASKGIYETRLEASNHYNNMITIDTIKKNYLEKFEEDEIYDFHVGSYFLVFRRPVIDSGFLENFLESVTKQLNKKNIILNYEVGLTRALINQGYTFDTYMEHLYPFHPLYTNTIFNMIDEGYPFFKRFLLTRNHYRAPELWRWKDKILKNCPDANIEAMQRNLTRVSDAENLRKNLYIPLPYVPTK